MRAIDADAIISQCKEYSNLLKYDGTTDREWAVVKRIILIIKEQPTIEPRCEACEAFNKTRLLIPQPQRKNGKWLTSDDIYETGICSCCRYDTQEPVSYVITNFGYCPHCGADMREDAEEPKKCDTCKHEKERWFSRCADCSDYELWEIKE